MNESAPHAPVTNLPTRAAVRSALGATRAAPLYAACLTVTLLILVAGTALAVWIAMGGGEGEAAAATTKPVTFSPGIPSAQLYPGAAAPVTLTMTNPNTAAVLVPALLLDTSQGTAGFAAAAECATPMLTFTPQDNAGAGWTVPGRIGTTPGSLDVTLPGALAMGTSAANGCQGTTFTVYLRANA